MDADGNLLVYYCMQITISRIIIIISERKAEIENKPIFNENFPYS